MTLADYLNLTQAQARAHDAVVRATLGHWPRLVPEWECDGEPCYACYSEKTGEHYTGTSSRAAFARMLEAEEVYLRHNLPQHPDILFTEVER